MVLLRDTRQKDFLLQLYAIYPTPYLLDDPPRELLLGFSYLEAWPYDRLFFLLFFYYRLYSGTES